MVPLAQAQHDTDLRQMAFKYEFVCMLTSAREHVHRYWHHPRGYHQYFCDSKTCRSAHDGQVLWSKYDAKDGGVPCLAGCLG